MLDASAGVHHGRRHLVDHVGGLTGGLSAHRALVPFEPQPSAVVARPAGRLLVVLHEEQLDGVLVRGHQAPLEPGRPEAAGRHPLERLVDEASLLVSLVGVHDLVGALAHLSRRHRPRVEGERARDAGLQLIGQEVPELGDRLLVPAEDEQIGARPADDFVHPRRGVPKVPARELLGFVVDGVLLVSLPPTRVVGLAERPPPYS